ncbi:MAG: hypothetical protein Q7O66_19165 [Dehalococcoidia bacterium]|nr:hypothetical protein [Dehalococcoidia bacterium]
MKGKRQFTQDEANQIRRLLEARSNASPDQQKRLRGAMRRLGFYITDFALSNDGFTLSDFENLIQQKRVAIAATVLESKVQTIAGCHGGTATAGRKRDEDYIIDLCDRVLGITASRHHRFDFLRGDGNTSLPVDAYYESLALVIEYREHHHTEQVDFFDKPDRKTVSGVHRGEQRRIYDQRRRNVLPNHGIQLIELPYSDFLHKAGGRLYRRKSEDLEIIQEKLAGCTI